jgi:hypothetical protein
MSQDRCMLGWVEGWGLNESIHNKLHGAVGSDNCSQLLDINFYSMDWEAGMNN